MTAGNSSGLNDAGAALLLTSGAQARERSCEPLGRLVSWAAVGVEPKLMGEGPIEATRRALTRAELSLADIDVIEINDSFSVQYIAVERALELDRERVNRQGGALALGHPMGATGTRLALSALYQLRRLGGGRAPMHPVRGRRARGCGCPGGLGEGDGRLSNQRHIVVVVNSRLELGLCRQPELGTAPTPHCGTALRVRFPLQAE